MVLIQIDIPEEISKVLKIFKIQRELGTQQRAIIFILKKTLIVEEQDG